MQPGEVDCHHGAQHGRLLLTNATVCRSYYAKRSKEVPGLQSMMSCFTSHAVLFPVNFDKCGCSLNCIFGCCSLNERSISFGSLISVVQARSQIAGTNLDGPST